jgi:hypothetical protein
MMSKAMKSDAKSLRDQRQPDTHEDDELRDDFWLSDQALDEVLASALSISEDDFFKNKSSIEEKTILGRIDRLYEYEEMMYFQRRRLNRIKRSYRIRASAIKKLYKCNRAKYGKKIYRFGAKSLSAHASRNDFSNCLRSGPTVTLESLAKRVANEAIRRDIGMIKSEYSYNPNKQG